MQHLTRTLYFGTTIILLREYSAIADSTSRMRAWQHESVIHSTTPPAQRAADLDLAALLHQAGGVNHAGHGLQLLHQSRLG